MLSRSPASNSVIEMIHILLEGEGEEGKKEGRKEGGKEGHSLSVRLRHYVMKKKSKSLNSETILS